MSILKGDDDYNTFYNIMNETHASRTIFVREGLDKALLKASKIMEESDQCWQPHRDCRMWTSVPRGDTINVLIRYDPNSEEYTDLRKKSNNNWSYVILK